MEMFPATLIPRKDLALSLLRIGDCPSLKPVEDSLANAEIEPDQILALLNSTVREVEQWQQAVDSTYRKAFEWSGRVLDVSDEMKKYSDLKLAVRSATAVHFFLDQSQSQEEADVSKLKSDLRDLKKQNNRLKQDNKTIAESMATQFEAFSDALKLCHQSWSSMSSLPLLDNQFQQIRRDKNALLEAIEKEEEEGSALLRDLNLVDSGGFSLGDCLASESTEIEYLKRLIEIESTRNARQIPDVPQIGDPDEDLLSQTELISNFLIKIGGSSVVSVSGNKVIMELVTAVSSERKNIGKDLLFKHVMSADLDPATLLVRGVQLDPNDGIGSLDMVRGSSLAATVSTVRSILTASMNRKAHMDSLSNFKFVAIDPGRGIWRVVLPSQVEVEIKIPLVWPYECEEEISILEIQSPMNTNFESLKQAMQSTPFKDLEALLCALSQRIMSSQKN